jgi:hypothetical protein
MKNDLPLVVRVPVTHTQFDIDAVDAEVYCVNSTPFEFNVSTRSESFTTVDEESGDTASHGSDPVVRKLAPGVTAMIAAVRGWEWDGHVGIEVKFERDGLPTVVKSYNLKSGSGDFTIEPGGRKGRVVSPE